MANRTISLSPIGDLIRKKMIEKEKMAFSSWVEARLMDWNANDREEIVEDEVKTLVPWNYQCQLCRQEGHHHSDCSMYNPEIHNAKTLVAQRRSQLP
jgi:hypothetical protein